MSWVLSKAPDFHRGTTLSEDDLGTIKIALASAASTTMDFWGRTHPGEGNQNIYDLALDKVIAMEEEGTTFESLCPDDAEANLMIGSTDPLFGGADDRGNSWFGSLFDHLFSWV